MKLSIMSNSKAKLFAAMLLSCLCALFMAGCAQEAPQEEAPQESEPEEVVRIFGVEDENALNMQFANDTEKDIKSLQAKRVSAEASEYGSNLITDGNSWAPGEKISLFCEAFEVLAVDQTSSSAKASDIEVKPSYDLLLTFADDSTITLHQVTFEESDEAEIHIDEATGLGYLTYTYEGNAASSLESEIAIQEQAAAAEAAAQEKAAAEAQAQAEAEKAAAEKKKSSSSKKTYNYNSNKSNSNSGSGSGAGQSADNCIDLGDVEFK